MPFCLGKYNMTTSIVYNPTQLANVNILNAITNIPSIDWKFNPTALVPNVYAVSNKPLYTISGIWMEKYLSNTSQLWCTGYNIPSTGKKILGIELILDMQRNARIEDLIIQLTLGGQLIGNNYASTINPVQSSMYTGGGPSDVYPVPVGDYNVYGGSLDLWGTALTSANVADPTFGIVVSFKSNAIYPHRDLAYIDQAGLRITYA